jgi:hypothetical protein
VRPLFEPRASYGGRAARKHGEESPLLITDRDGDLRATAYGSSSLSGSSTARAAKWRPRRENMGDDSTRDIHRA